MRTQKLVIGLVLTTLFALPTLPQALSAQGLWGLPTYEKSVALEFAKPLFEEGNQSFLSSGNFISVTWPLSERIRFVGEIPFAYSSWDNEFESESQFALGNPYLGLSIGKETSNLLGQVGLRLPLASDDNDDARWLGTFADYVDREGDFFGDIVPITGTLTYRNRQENGFLVMATGGADTWIFTEGGGDGAEVFALYGARLGYDGPAWTVLGGIAGRGILTEESSFFDDGSVHEVGLEVGYRTAAVQPKLFVRYPLDKDIREFLDLVVGFGIRVGF